MMKHVARIGLTLFVAVAVASPLVAQEKKNKVKKQSCPVVLERIFHPKTITLTEEQQAKTKELCKKYAPEIRKLWKKANAQYTEEQRKARIEAKKAAKEEGKEGKELSQAVAAAVTLTDEQKEGLAAVKNEQRELLKEVQEEFECLLNDEQKAQLPKKGKKKGGKKKTKAE